MASIEWRVRADEFANCNCSYGCPCQFNALPTHGFCEATAGWKIHEGHFGEVRLDGLSSAQRSLPAGPERYARVTPRQQRHATGFSVGAPITSPHRPRYRFERKALIGYGHPARLVLGAG